MKILDTIKANLKVPHPTLVAVGISAVITAVTAGDSIWQILDYLDRILLKLEEGTDLSLVMMFGDPN